MTMTLDPVATRQLAGVQGLAEGGGEMQGLGQFDFEIEALQRDGDDLHFQAENLEDAQAEFQRLKDRDDIKRAELIDARSGNVLDEFEKDDGFPFLLVFGGLAAAVGGYFLWRKWQESRGGDGLSGLLAAAPPGGDCGCS